MDIHSVWLVPVTSDDPKDAATNIMVHISDDAVSGYDDLAKGAGGKYRYLFIQRDSDVGQKAFKVALMRKAKDDGPVTIEQAAAEGYNRLTGDINVGRGGDYLHLVYSVTDY